MYIYRLPLPPGERGATEVMLAEKEFPADRDEALARRYAVETYGPGGRLFKEIPMETETPPWNVSEDGRVVSRPEPGGINE